MINQVNSHNSKNRSERSGEVSGSRKGWRCSRWAEERLAKQFALRTERNPGKGTASPQWQYQGSTALPCEWVLMDLWVNKFPPRSAFSTETCWHCQVSTDSTSPLPLLTFLSVQHLTWQIQPQFTSPGLYSLQLPPALHTDTSLWLPPRHEWRTAGSDHPGAIPQPPSPPSYEPRPSTKMLNGTSHPPAAVLPFSQATPDVSVYFLASDCWLTLSWPHWGRDSDLLLVVRIRSHFDEYLEGILQTL